MDTSIAGPSSVILIFELIKAYGVDSKGRTHVPYEANY